MCGIAGIFNQRNDSVSPDILKNMLGQIKHRGPDESGVYLNGSLGIGNVRLSIIDISSGQQPISNHDDTLWIVYNGEVFNYIELREDLIQKGVRFKTDSDTEVVLKYYELYGQDCLKYFNGQFAFAIWNNRKRELFLARDRMGIRPLYYAKTDHSFVFASEIKSVFASRKIEARIDTKALKQVFTFWTTLSPDTCFEGVRELPPGHFMKVSAKDFEIKKYWSLSFSSEYKYRKNNQDEASEEFRSLFEQAVKLRLRADVPVAAYLSGGLDSSSTTYFAKKVAKDKLQTFSIGFSDKDYDESAYQKEVSSYLKTQHTSFSCSNQDIAKNFPDVIWHTEFPILRTAPVPMYCLSKNVRDNNIKVVITGEGADEMLGGYNIFKEMFIRRFWARYPDSALRPLLLKKLYPYIPQLQRQNGKMLKFFFGYKLQDVNLPYYSHLLRWNNSSKVAGYLSDDMLAHTSDYDPLTGMDDYFNKEFDSWDPLAKAQWIESGIFMSGYLLSSQGDRMAMANSVEGRYPFLDHKVVEFCTKLHPDLKLAGLNEKFILKYLMKDKIPASVINRPKQAYRAPVSSSFLSPGAPDYVQELLSSEKIKEFGIFNPQRVAKMTDKMRGNPSTELENMSISAILSTQLLYQKFVLENTTRRDITLDDCQIINGQSLSTQKY